MVRFLAGVIVGLFALGSPAGAQAPLGKTAPHLQRHRWIPGVGLGSL